MPVIKKRVKKAKKYSQEEIKGIAHELFEFMAPYKNRILIIVISIAAVVVALGGYLLLQSSWDKKASPLLAAAYEYYKPSTGLPPDYSKSLELYRDIQQKYASTRSGAIAQFYVANSLSQLGDHEKAITEYEYFVKKYSGETFLLGQVYQRMGYTYGILGRQDEAVAAFERSEAIQGPGLSTVELAKLHERKGNTEKAQEKYKVIAEELPGTPWAFEAMSKLPKETAAVPGTGTQDEGKKITNKENQ